MNLLDWISLKEDHDMQWQDQGIVLTTRKYKDNLLIMKVITENNGIYSGLIRVKKLEGGHGVNLAGNNLHIKWRARLSEHLGFFNTEMNKSRANDIMKDPIILFGVNTLCSHLNLYPEREPCAKLFKALDQLISETNNLPLWLVFFVRYELTFLEMMGYGLDLKECAVTGDHDGLAWVSPKSGRAVSINAGKKWESKLLILPKFLTNNDQNKITKKDIINGLNLTEYFLKKRIYSDINKNLPQTRKKLIDFLNK